jgi:hypothetical protein
MRYLPKVGRASETNIADQRSAAFRGRTSESGTGVQSDWPPRLIGGQSAAHQSPCGSVVRPTSMRRASRQGNSLVDATRLPSGAASCRRRHSIPGPPGGDLGADQGL